MLQLEVNANCFDKTRVAAGPLGGHILATPPIGEDYWVYRVKLSSEQAIIGFPKFATIGIGFAKEEDWNTNLPYSCEAQQIYNHIKHNKGDDAISDDDCLQAIAMIQNAATTNN